MKIRQIILVLAATLLLVACEDEDSTVSRGDMAPASAGFDEVRRAAQGQTVRWWMFERRKALIYRAFP